MKPEVCASLDLSTCQIAVWLDLSVTRFSAISDCTGILEEVRLQRESCVYIVIFCREIVANNSRTSLQLSHSSEIGA